ncbi:MAG: threonylcarbamoyl-AMP synthase [Ignavibacteriales bacterium]|nr:threonylcarbamoyl-AMP synthase [Ignavibacteriales bacterium]
MVKSKIITLDENINIDSVVQKAAEYIMRGEIILYPTDTIYGLGCNAFNANAVEKLFRIKERSPTNPALMLISGIEMLEKIVQPPTSIAKKIIEKFWPGPLTLLFTPIDRMSDLLVSDKSKIGVRMPANKFCRNLSNKCNAPIVSTSANISGMETSGKMSDLIKLFDDKVELIVDNGDALNSQPSTIVDLTGDQLRIIREGAIPVSEIFAIMNNF